MLFDTLAELHVRGTLAGVDGTWVMSNWTQELNSYPFTLYSYQNRPNELNIPSTVTNHKHNHLKDERIHLDIANAVNFKTKLETAIDNQFISFCSGNPCLAIQPPDIEQVNN
jgi:hypothetical protein